MAKKLLLDKAHVPGIRSKEDTVVLKKHFV